MSLYASKCSGAYAYGLTDRTQYGAAIGPSGQGWFEKGWGGPSWGKFASAGAWWAGLATILAATISCVCHDRIWFIVSCALNAAACCVSIAGASIDGIYNTWMRSVKTCVMWDGVPKWSADSQKDLKFPYWATTGGWQYYGSVSYAPEALMCASALSNGYQSSSDNYINQNNMPIANSTAILAASEKSNPRFTETGLFAGPLWWYQVLLKAGGTGTESLSVAIIKYASSIPGYASSTNFIGRIPGVGKFDPPARTSCFCKWDNTTVATQGTPTSSANPQSSVPLNFNWDYPLQRTQRLNGAEYFPSTGNNYLQTKDTFNAFNNCFQINTNAGAGLTCQNIVKDGDTIFAVSVAFCCFCSALTLLLSYYNGKAFEWYKTHEEEVTRKQNAKGFGLEGGSVNH